MRLPNTVPNRDICPAHCYSPYDPIEAIARAVWRLVRIHPWDDGNGRTARKYAAQRWTFVADHRLCCVLLRAVCLGFMTDVLLLRAGLAPSFILLQNRADYYSALEWCDINNGDGRHFTNWLARSVDSTLDLYRAGGTGAGADEHANAALLHASESSKVL